MSPDKAARLRELIQEMEAIFSEGSDLSHLKNMDDIEMETRRRIQEHVAPELMSFLVPRVAGETSPDHPKKSHRRRLTTTQGTLVLNAEQAKRLGVRKSSQFSPLLERFALVAAAKASFEQASQDLKFLCGFKISDSTLQRLVQRSVFPSDSPVHGLGEDLGAVQHVCADGGKVRLAPGAQECGTVWRDYKAVTVNGGLPEQERHARLMDNTALAARIGDRSGMAEATFVGDGHAGVWNLVEEIRPSDSTGLEILDWYHLKENLWKYSWSKTRRDRICELLWHGKVDQVLREEVPQTDHRFHKYLQTHRRRIVNYALRQAAGQIIGSGSVESTIKQIDARLQLPGAWWNPTNVNQMLDLRNAYLNGWLYSPSGKS